MDFHWRGVAVAVAVAVKLVLRGEQRLLINEGRRKIETDTVLNKEDNGVGDDGKSTERIMLNY